MSEKLAEVFEQYDMNILSTKKGRGSTIITASDGIRILEPFRGSMSRLEQEYVLKQLFEERKCSNLDYIIPNKDGQLFTCDKYRQPYVMKQHYEGAECDMRNPEDIIPVIRALAEFHLQGRWVAGAFEDRWRKWCIVKEERRVEEIRKAIEDGEEMERIAYLYEISRSALQKAIESEDNNQFEAGDRKDQIEESYISDELDKFERHNAQIRKIGRFVSKVKRRNTFENLFLRVYTDFYNQGVKSVEMLTGGIGQDSERYDRRNCSVNFVEKVLKNHYGICHGSFNQHNVIIGEDCIAIVHFERFSRGNQLNDLYQFSRKVMEKNNYDFALLKDILNAYSETINLNSEDYEYLYILFSYPEKFWKIANSYYNSSKAFLSPKYIEKLENVICQENEKKEMLDRMKGIVFGSV